jgi:hypothetical protein
MDAGKGERKPTRYVSGPNNSVQQLSTMHFQVIALKRRRVTPLVEGISWCRDLPEISLNDRWILQGAKPKC